MIGHRCISSRKFVALFLTVLTFLGLAGEVWAAGHGSAPVRAQLDHRTAHAVNGRFVGIDVLTDSRETVAIGFVIDHRYIYDTRAELRPSTDVGLRREIDEVEERVAAEHLSQVVTSLNLFLRDYTARLTSGVSAEIVPRGQGYAVHMKGPGRDRRREEQDFKRISKAIDAERKRVSASLRAEFRQWQTELVEDVYARYSFAVYDGPDGKGLIPDYAVIARRDVEAVAELAHAIRAVSGADPKMSREDRDRAVVSFAVGLLQTIPYDLLADRSEKALNGFVRPVDLFLGNRGDCDTKGTAFGALMATLLPSRKAIQVLIEGHAVVGVEMPMRQGDSGLTYQGRTYVLAEVAGPGVIPFGKLAADSLREIELGRVHKVIEF